MASPPLRDPPITAALAEANIEVRAKGYAGVTWRNMSEAEKEDEVAFLGLAGGEYVMVEDERGLTREMEAKAKKQAEEDREALGKAARDAWKRFWDGVVEVGERGRRVLGRVVDDAAVWIENELSDEGMKRMKNCDGGAR